MSTVISSQRIVLTQGMITNGYLSVPKDLFPKDSWRYENTPQQALLINLNVNNEYSLRTEYSIYHNGLRRLPKIKTFFAKHALRAGRAVVLERISLYEYRLNLDRSIS